MDISEQTNSQESKKQTFLQSLMVIITSLIGLSAIFGTYQAMKNSQAQTQLNENQSKILQSINNLEHARLVEEKKVLAKEDIYDFEKTLSSETIDGLVFEKLNNGGIISNKQNLDNFVSKLNLLGNLYCQGNISSYELKTSFEKDYSKICASEVISQYSGSTGLAAICKNLYPNINGISKYSCI